MKARNCRALINPDGLLNQDRKPLVIKNGNTNSVIQIQSYKISSTKTKKGALTQVNAPFYIKTALSQRLWRLP
ncbi:hypothetical protein GCM10022277_06940 [Litoribacillus peritrichatus]|uniref:Uncharacterized protein n=1 Tax=Litoribacillus peritrichatus TaxID=718191 RepID=A0ABP7M953_9GAMM